MTIIEYPPLHVFHNAITGVTPNLIASSHPNYPSLNGKQAAWAAKKYHRHHIIPDSILRDLEKANIT